MENVLNNYYQIDSCIFCSSALENSKWKEDFKVIECKKCNSYKVYYEKLLDNGKPDIHTVKIYDEQKLDDNIYCCITQKFTQFISYEMRMRFNDSDELKIVLKEVELGEVCVEYPMEINTSNIREQHEIAKQRYKDLYAFK